LLAAVVLAALPPAARPMLPADPESRGEAFEQAIAAALTKVRAAGEEWAIAVDPADINAWLATRLPKWIAHDPELAALEPARTVRIAAVAGGLVVEDSAHANGAAVLTLPVTPSLADGRLLLEIGTARIGRLPVPGSASALAALARDSLNRLASGPARIPLADRRTVELRGIECVSGEIRLLFATLPPPSEPRDGAAPR
ncbi:MAG: hypothetical protein ACO3QC_10440, partial [Phycisphaerales bacterium]